MTYDVEGYGITQPYLYNTNISYAEERRKHSMIPKEYTGKLGSDFDWKFYKDDTTVQKNIVNVFVSQFDKFRSSGRGLYIHSKTKGSGKTLLACCLANEIAGRYNAVIKFCSVLDYLEVVKDKSEDGASTMDSLKKCSLLILDDIGVQTDKKEWIVNCLFSLIDCRYRENRPTIYTSNCEIEKASTDDRTQDRIYRASIPVYVPEVPVRKMLADKYNKTFLNEILEQNSNLN